jgi:hypothetical protein
LDMNRCVAIVMALRTVLLAAIPTYASSL